MTDTDVQLNNRIEASAQLENIYQAIGTIAQNGAVNSTVLLALNRAFGDALVLLDENLGHATDLAHMRSQRHTAQ